VRRAVDFIVSNAERELTLSDIAAAAGIGPRGLQAAFLRHQDATPTTYVRRVRLDRAHRELVDSDPTDRDTVPVVAARWSFPGRAHSSPLISRSRDPSPARPGQAEGGQHHPDARPASAPPPGMGRDR